MEKEQDCPLVIHEASFHGESWYYCPHCGKPIEGYDFDRQDGVKRISRLVYRCQECGKLMTYIR